MVGQLAERALALMPAKLTNTRWPVLPVKVSLALWPMLVVTVVALPSAFTAALESAATVETAMVALPASVPPGLKTKV